MARVPSPELQVQWLQTVYEVAPVAVLGVDTAHSIVLANRRAELLFGFPRDELLGQNLAFLIPARVREVHTAHMRSFFASPDARLMGVGRDLLALRKDGSEVPVEIGLTPLDTVSGLITLAFVIDITDRKQRDEELRRSNEELTQFAYVAAHDLREPLRTIGTFVGMVSERLGEDLDATTQQYFGYVTNGVERMQAMIESLLDYARSGAPEGPRVGVDLGKLVDEVLFLFGDKIRETGAQISVGSLPVVEGEAIQLGRVFQNLLSNALKFRSERPPVIRVEATRQGPMWQILVEDNGVGLDPKYADQVFQLFHRFHSRAQYQGSGIGLAVVKRIVDRHGGTIGFDSSVGVGTRFRFTLPAGGPTLTSGASP